MSLRVSLIFPPEWTAAQPHFAIASLAGQIRRAGHVVSVHDLNLQVVLSALEGGALTYARARAQNERRLLAASAVARIAAADKSEDFSLHAQKLVTLEKYLDGGPELDQVIESAFAARATLSGATFYDPVELVRALAAVDKALELYSLPFHPNELRWNDFYAPLVKFDFEPIKSFTSDPLANPFYRFFEDRLRRLFREGPDVLAVSINAFSQVLPGLTLTRMLVAERNRRRSLGEKDVHVVIGGNFFSRLKSALMKRPEMFELFTDSIVIGEGERPIVELIEALDPDHERTLDEVSNLLRLDPESKTVRFSHSSHGMPMSDMAYQDFSAMPLDRYLSPDRVVCVRLTKGCYYGRCTFCDSHHGLEPDRMSVDRLVAELEHLNKNFGIKNFELVDQAVSPADMRMLSEAIIASNLDIRWFANGWTDPRFDRETFELARRAGATMLMWGIETASPRLLKAMKKGVSPTRRMEVLGSAHDSGLWNFAYVFFGFPTETEEEAMQTVELLKTSSDIIHSYGRSVFTLNRHSPLFANPEGTGITRIVEHQQDFSTYVSFETDSGMTGLEVSRMAQRMNDILREAQGDPLWMALRSRENLHLYLARHGKEFVRNFRFQKRARTQSRAAEFVF